MSTNRLRRTETPQRLATPVSTPTSGSNITLPRPYGSHTVSIPCTRFPMFTLRATAAAATVVIVVVGWWWWWSFATWTALAFRCNFLFPHARVYREYMYIHTYVPLIPTTCVEMMRDVTRRLRVFMDARSRASLISLSVEFQAVSYATASRICLGWRFY